VRIVVKVGTSSLTDEIGAINTGFVGRLSEQIAMLNQQDHQIVVVSSGAISAGVAALGLSARPTDVTTLQAIAAAGQSRLMDVWSRALGEHDLVVAQVLLVPHDFVNRRQYLHTRKTLTKLQELGCIPIINENDAIASDEIRFGDNDRIAALVSHNVGADVLVLLTDTEGLYTSDPRRDASATLIREVGANDPLLDVRATQRGTVRGSGGMASKLAAARIASSSGVVTVIAAAERPNVLLDAVDGLLVGTTFRASSRRLPARKLWIAFAARPNGRVTVDDGARGALIERGTSLLPAGVTAVTGNFHEHDVVEICDQAGTVIARGLVQLDASALRTVAGKRTTEIPSNVAHEVIHRDDLVTMI